MLLVASDARLKAGHPTEVFGELPVGSCRPDHTRTSYGDPRSMVAL